MEKYALNKPPRGGGRGAPLKYTKRKNDNEECYRTMDPLFRGDGSHFSPFPDPFVSSRTLNEPSPRIGGL